MTVFIRLWYLCYINFIKRIWKLYLFLHSGSFHSILNCLIFKDLQGFSWKTEGGHFSWCRANFFWQFQFPLQKLVCVQILLLFSFLFSSFNLLITNFVLIYFFFYLVVSLTLIQKLTFIFLKYTCFYSHEFSEYQYMLYHKFWYLVFSRKIIQF